MAYLVYDHTQGLQGSGRYALTLLEPIAIGPLAESSRNLENEIDRRFLSNCSLFINTPFRGHQMRESNSSIRTIEHKNQTKNSL